MRRLLELKFVGDCWMGIKQKWLHVWIAFSLVMSRGCITILPETKRNFMERRSKDEVGLVKLSKIFAIRERRSVNDAYIHTVVNCWTKSRWTTVEDPPYIHDSSPCHYHSLDHSRRLREHNNLKTMMGWNPELLISDMPFYFQWYRNQKIANAKVFNC